MTTQEIASRLVELSRKGDFESAQKELFAEHVQSIEPYETPEFKKVTEGLQAILEKGHKFEEMTQELHAITVSDPLVAGKSFACTMRMDITMKQGGRMDIQEICIYKVEDGKVVSEEFLM